MTRPAKLQLVLVFLCLAAIFTILSRHRLIDGDEGFYLLAAKLVFQGKLLYRDFLYTQMPLLPFVYGLWLKVAGETWNSGRLLAALLASLLGCLLYSNVARITGSRLAGCCALLLFVSSTGILVWMPLVKTYSLSLVFLFGAYHLLCDVSERGTLALAGLLLGLSIDTRLYLAGVLPVFLWWIYLRRAALPRLTTAYAWFFAGLALGLTPNLPFFLASPQNYYFNNLGYHAIRSDAGLIGGFRYKAGILLRAVGLFRTSEIAGWPFGLLVLVNALGALYYRSLAPLAGFVAAMLIVLSTLPNPAFLQYYCVAIPFLIAGAVAVVWRGAFSKVRIALTACLMLVYAAPLPAELRRYLSSGEFVIGVETPDRAINFRLESVSQVSREIDKLAAPGEPALSFWPGYLLESHAACVPGMETHVGLFIANKLSVDALRQYRILSEADIEGGLDRHSPCLVILGNEDTMHPSGALFPSILERDGYRVAYRLGNTAAYTCKP